MRARSRTLIRPESLFPNDEIEQDNQDLFHHMVLLTLNGKLYCAPFELVGKRVLDLGTGTGTWAQSIGDADATCLVVGTDLSPIQPTWVPPNVQYQIADIEDDWTWNHKQNFIFLRQLALCVVDWGKLISQCSE